MSNFRRRSRLTSEVSTSAMNDIMFFLLLFFLIVSTMVNPSVIKLMLPKASTGQSENKRSFTISVTKDLQYYVDNVPVTFDQLQPTLEKKMAVVKDTKDVTFILRADRSVTLQDIVGIFEIANKLKVKIVLATTNK